MTAPSLARRLASTLRSVPSRRMEANSTVRFPPLKPPGATYMIRLPSSLKVSRLSEGALTTSFSSPPSDSSQTMMPVLRDQMLRLAAASSRTMAIREPSRDQAGWM